MAIQWHGRDLWTLTAEELRELPNPLLYGMVKFHHLRHGAIEPVQLEQRPLVIAEARRRNFTGHALESLDPKPCACGRKGIYIVGRITYCRFHKSNAIDHLARTGAAIRDAEARRAALFFQDADRRGRNSDKIRAFERSRRRGHR